MPVGGEASYLSSACHHRILAPRDGGGLQALASVSELVDDRCLACGFRSGPVGSAHVGGEKPTRGRSPDPGCLRRMSGWQGGSGSSPAYSLCW